MSAIFITGASSGIGKATALLFAEQGWEVVAAARSFDKAPELAAAGIRTRTLDVADPAQILSVVRAVIDESDIDVVFNNAGHNLMGPAEFLSDEDLEYEFAVNLLGPIRVSRAFIPTFRERGRGLIVNTTSLSAIVAAPFMSAYSASKAGLERWSFAMNLELNPFGVQVKTILPGIVRTGLQSAGTLVGGEPYGEHMQKVGAAFQSEQLQRLMSSPEGTAAVVYAAVVDGSDRIRYLTDAIGATQLSMLDGFGEERLQSFATQVFA